MPLQEGLESTTPLEMLSFTPGLVGHPSEMQLSIQPQPIFVPTDEPGRYRIATARQARENKARAISKLGDTADEAMGWGSKGEGKGE